MRGKQEKSKHGGKEHREPTHWESDVNASSSQWSSNTQSDYPPESTPRSSPLDDLNSGLENCHLGGSGPVSDPPYYSNSGDPTTGLAYDYASSPPTYTTGGSPYDNQAGHTPMAQSYSQNPGGNDYSNTYSPYGTPQTSYQHGYNDKGKEVSYNSGSANYDTGAYHGHAAYMPDTSSSLGTGGGRGGAPGSHHYNYNPNEAMNEFEEGESDDEEDDGEEEGEEGEDDEGGYYGDGGMTRAMNESRQAYYGQDQAAGSSRAASAYAPAYPHATFDDPSQTPRALDPSATDLPSTMTNLDPLDTEEENSMGVDPSNFSVVPSYYYQPGSVFKMLWSEPRGKQITSKSTGLPTELNATLPTENGWNHEKNFYVGVRRFVIIATDRAHHSTCVPILTYEHRACTKPGVQPGVHGIIYSQGRRPEMKLGEKELGYRPVSCTMNPHESLVKESRVNYSKLVTIEHNVDVQFIGSITESDFAIVQQAVDDCWRKKNRHSTRDSKSKSKTLKPSKSKSSKPSKSKTEPEPRHKSSSSKTSSDRKHSKRTH